ncbi:MAG TPA: hypothetical protein VEV44_05790, partial [Pseudoneobacillus sp.]|nr:hypothetical protein [Pseudoneobacillus sp.]
QMPMQQMPYGGQQMPMQQMPYMGQQMPTGTMESPEDYGLEQYPTVGMAQDCGCGGPTFPTTAVNPYAGATTFPTAPVNPYAGAPGVYTPAYGGQMAQAPYMNPYGFGAGSVPAPRGFEESSEFDR